MSTQTLLIDVSPSTQIINVGVDINQMVVQVPPKENLQLEVQLSVVSPTQILLLKGIRDRSELARDRAVDAETASANSANSAAASESQSADYRDETTVLHDKTERLNQQTVVLHDESRIYCNDAESASGEAENSANLSVSSSESSKSSASDAERSRQASDNSAAASKASETSAKASQAASKTSETNAASSEAIATSSASSSSVSSDESAASAAESLKSQQASKASETASVSSASAAKSSETASASSASAAKTSETAASDSASAAKASETASASSAGSAKTSETAAKTSETNSAEHAATSSNAHAASEIAMNLAQKWATEVENKPVLDNEFSSLHWAKVAERFASTLTNGMYFAGAWCLSDGFPPTPDGLQVPWYRLKCDDSTKADVDSELWRKLTRASSEGDQLIWDPISKEWFVLDTSDRVWLVNGKQGSVVLNAVDVGARSDSWNPEWNDVNSKPASFPPATHDHDWDSVTGKPSTYPPSTHNHDDAYADKSHSHSDYVVTTRTINGKALSGDVTLSASEVKALPAISGSVSAANISFNKGHGLQLTSTNQIRTGAETDGLLVIGGRDSTAIRLVSDRVAVISNGDINNAGGVIYHEGNKPSASDVGARSKIWVPEWEDVTGKPATFPPSSHTHDYVPTTRTINGKALSGDVTLSASDVAAKPESYVPGWNDIASKPSTFPASPHNHDQSYLSADHLTFGDKPENPKAGFINIEEINVPASGWKALPRSLNSGISTEIIYSLAASGDTFVAGFANGYASISTDKGQTWKYLPHGLNSGSTDTINALAASGDTFVAGFANGYASRQQKGYTVFRKSLYTGKDWLEL